MATRQPSIRLRKGIREKIRARIDTLDMTRAVAGKKLGMNKAQMSRLFDDQDIFSLDRLVDAASSLGLEVRMTAARRKA